MKNEAMAELTIGLEANDEAEAHERAYQIIEEDFKIQVIGIKEYTVFKEYKNGTILNKIISSYLVAKGYDDIESKVSSFAGEYKEIMHLWDSQISDLIDNGLTEKNIVEEFIKVFR